MCPSTERHDTSDYSKCDTGLSLLSCLVKHIDVDLLKGMSAAELIDLVMNFVIYPSVIILYTIIPQCIIHEIFMKAVNNLKGHSSKTFKHYKRKQWK